MNLFEIVTDLAPSILMSVFDGYSTVCPDNNGRTVTAPQA